MNRTTAIEEERMKDLLGYFYEEERVQRFDISSVEDLIKAHDQLGKAQEKVSDIYGGYIEGTIVVDNTLRMLLIDIESRAKSIVGIVESFDLDTGGERE